MLDTTTANCSVSQNASQSIAMMTLPAGVPQVRVPALLSRGLSLVGYREPISNKHVRHWFGLDIFHERQGFLLVSRSPDHDHPLIERWIRRHWNFPILTLPLHRRRSSVRHRYETDLGVS